MALALLALPACSVDQTRAGLPPEAQAVISRFTEDLAEERYSKIYDEAAEEWRRAATPEQSAQVLMTLRRKLGRVESRAYQTGKEQQNTGGELPGHSLIVTYNTKFERASGREVFTLVEREGRWLLARYFVNSDALR